MFQETHYVPILRWKQAERFALRELDEQDRSRITPLIELTPAVFKARKRGGLSQTPDPANVLRGEVKKLLESCKYAPFFLDAHFVDGDIRATGGKKHSLEYLAGIARDYKLALVPVTGMSRSTGYQTSVSRVAKEDGRGACVRITPQEILLPRFADEIKRFLKFLALNPKSVHLLVDCEASESAVSDLEFALAQIPNLNDWKTFSVAGGAFPPDLQKFQPGNWRIPRRDWLAWKELITRGKQLVRRPSYSDSLLSKLAENSAWQ